MLSNGVARRKVAEQFGLSQSAIWRHWKNHMPQDVKERLAVTGVSDPKVDLEKLKRVESDSLLQNLISERARLQRIADECENIGNHTDAVRASTAVIRTLESIGKLLGELKVGGTTIHQNFSVSPDWFQMRRLLVTALRPHPAAQRAVLAALRDYEASRGADASHALTVIEPEMI